MTFVLKDLVQLNEEFEDVKTIILSNEKNGKIEDTSEKRKHLLQLLQSTLNYISNSEECIVEDRFQNTTVYGVINLIIQHINGTRWFTSAFADALSGMMKNSKSTTEQPTAAQIASFYTSANILFNVVFQKYDSRQGINSEHPFKAIPTENLTELMRLGYKLEKQSQKEFIATIESKESVDELASADTFVPTKPIPNSAVSVFETFDKLQEKVKDLVLREIGQKGYGTMATFTKKHPERALQLQFLEHIRESLLASSLKDETKRAILAGSMYLVVEQISKELSLSSKVYDQLREMLRVATTDPEDKEVLMVTANKYIRHMTLKGSDEAKRFRKENIFSKIEGFKLIPVLNLFQDMIFAQREEALNTVVKEFTHVNKSTEKVNSGWGMTTLTSLMTFGGKKSKEDEESAEKKLVVDPVAIPKV
jgi:hypothetical protein